MTAPILALLGIVLIASALFPAFRLWAWSFNAGYWYMRHGPALIRPHWSFEQYRVWQRLFAGFTGAFILVIGGGVWLVSLQAR